MKTINTSHSLKYRLATFVLDLALALPLHATIRNTDLARVTQSIQESKTACAEADVALTLEDNPEDPNTLRLRTILESLGGANELSDSQPPAALPTTQNGRLSEKEMREWIQANLEHPGSYSFCVDSSSEQKGWLLDIKMKDGTLTISQYTHPVDSVTKRVVSLKNALGTVKVICSDPCSQKTARLEIFEWDSFVETTCTYKRNELEDRFETDGKNVWIDGKLLKELKNPIGKLGRGIVKCRDQDHQNRKSYG